MVVVGVKFVNTKVVGYSAIEHILEQAHVDLFLTADLMTKKEMKLQENKYGWIFLRFLPWTLSLSHENSKKYEKG